MEITKLNEERLEDIYLLFKNQLGILAWTKQQILDSLKSENTLFYGIILSGELASCVSILNGIDNIEILDVATKENYKKQGFAQKLINFVIANKSEEQSVSLEVAVENVPAIKLYEKLNFKKVRRIKKFYSNGEDAFSMFYNFKSN